MFSTVKINEEQTLARFGYTVASLKSGSHDKIIVECTGCHSLICRERRNANKVHQCPSVIGRQKRCFACKLWKDLSDFNKAPKQSGGVSKLCRHCYNSHPSVARCEANRRYRRKHSLENDLNLYIKTRAYGLLHRCKKNSIDCDVDAEYLMNLWSLQNGRCYYSDIPMGNVLSQRGFQSWDAPSVDRKDPAKGYIKGNLVWCAFAVNSFKQTLSMDEFEKMIKNSKWWFERTESKDAETT